MVVEFKGTAHPPPRRDGKRSNIADLSSAEIQVTNLGKNGGTQMLVEHDHGLPCGRVLSSWTGPAGEMRVSGVLDDPVAVGHVRSGKMRGLSLGTSVITGENQERLGVMHDELSICEQPRRGGCWIDSVDGKRVGQRQNFSKGAFRAKKP